MILLRLCLHIGCDPDDSMNCGTRIDCSIATDWERWLTRVTRQMGRFDRRAATTARVSSTDEVSHRFRNNNADVITLLLQHGADPACAPCMSDHARRRRDTMKERCSRVPFIELLADLVPSERVAQIEVLRASCMDRVHRYMNRRKQRLKAMRSLLTSEQRFQAILSRASLPPAQRSDVQEEWDRQQAGFFQIFVGEALSASRKSSPACEESSDDGVYYLYLAPEPKLVSWCVDCQGMFWYCTACTRKAQMGTLHQRNPCKDVTGDPNLATGDHTIITVVYDRFVGAFWFESTMPGEHDYTAATAILTLKQWYFRHAAKQGVSI